MYASGVDVLHIIKAQPQTNMFDICCSPCIVDVSAYVLDSIWKHDMPINVYAHMQCSAVKFMR